MVRIISLKIRNTSIRIDFLSLLFWCYNLISRELLSNQWNLVCINIQTSQLSVQSHVKKNGINDDLLLRHHQIINPLTAGTEYIRF